MNRKIIIGLLSRLAAMRKGVYSTSLAHSDGEIITAAILALESPTVDVEGGRVMEWIKVEPGCEMPGRDERVIGMHVDGTWHPTHVTGDTEAWTHWMRVDPPKDQPSSGDE